MNARIVRIAVVSLALVGGTTFAMTRHHDSSLPHTSTDLVYVQPNDGYGQLTPDQELDRVLSLGGYRGVVQGRLGVPVRHSITVANAGIEEFVKHNPNVGSLQQFEHPTVIDIPLVVGSVFGTQNPPYANGSTITLRLPVAGDLGVPDSNLPATSAGQTVLVFVRDQGVVIGGSGATVLVATSPGDIAQVSNGSVTWAGFTEDYGTFVQHFIEHPVPAS